MRLLTIDIGGSTIKYGIFSRNRLESLGSAPTPSQRSEFLELLQEIREEVTEYDIQGVAISCPGDVDEEKGAVYGVSFVPFLHIIPIKNEIERVFELPVSMMNDAQSAALAEMKLGVGKDHQNPLFVVVGSGIGVAWAENGVVVTHTEGISKRLKKWAIDFLRSFKGFSSSMVHTAKRVSIKKLEEFDFYDGEDVYELADQNDDVAIHQLRIMYNSLADTLIALCINLQPEFVVLGGGITQNPRFFNELNEVVQSKISDKEWWMQFFEKISDEEPIQSIELKICSFKNEANLIGAALHFIEIFKT